MLQHTCGCRVGLISSADVYKQIAVGVCHVGPRYLLNYLKYQYGVVGTCKMGGTLVQSLWVSSGDRSFKST